tara:strand:- start:8239 stop:10362 length:2124 start_codon:yes stop_codon:yes gene_type:complete
LDGISVVEIGERYGVGVCCSFLAQLGADVYFLEGEETAHTIGKWPHRDILSAGKRRVDILTARDETRSAASVADIIVVSSDVDGKVRRELSQSAGPGTIVADVNAFGTKGPFGNLPYSDAMVQAVSGMMDVTGMPGCPPSVSTLLLLEGSAGLYAAAGILAALRVRSGTNCGQMVETTLYDCAVNFLTTFLPAHYGNKPPTRLGNGHSMVVPWNCYNTSDGRVQICSVTDRQWQNLCKAIERPDIQANQDMEKLAGRVPVRTMIDEAIEAWTQRTSTEACVSILNKANIACGPVLTVAELAGDENLKHRKMVRTVKGLDGQTVQLPASPIRGRQWSGVSPNNLTMPGSGNAAFKEFVATATSVSPDTSKGSDKDLASPLKGLRVLEIGQFTTAPLAGKALASLGAEVIKIEPPGGDSARQWSPHRHDLSYFFVLSNSDKSSVEIDLNSSQGKRDFSNLIASADILLENLKAGSLERLGFSPDVLMKLNPRIIYCPISGFGYDGVYTGRPAFDTVVQAMSGLMDMTHDQGVPIKCGASISDVSGGQLALITILASLLLRDHTGQGCSFDLSMQDIGAYLTQTRWNEDAKPVGQTFKCNNGYVYAETIDDIACSNDISCEQLVGALRDTGIGAAEIATISDVAVSEQTRARNLIFDSLPDNGKTWPLLNSPVKLSRTPTRVERAIGIPKKMTDEMRDQLGIERELYDAL